MAVVMRPGERQCQGMTHRLGACKKPAIAGFDFCIRHMPDELLPEAEALGYERCKATVNLKVNPRYGQRCGEQPVNGTPYCAYHQPKEKWLAPKTQEQKRAVVRIHSAATAEGIDTSKVANPLQALLELTAEAHSFKEELRRRVVLLQANEWRYENIAGEQIRGDVILYERAIDRLGRLLTTVSKLGIEERLARVTERQAHLVEQAVLAAFEEIGLPLDVQDQAREVVSRHLRAVE